ncbi:alpha/beta fold hydrolase [Sorangium sp. So ce1335]|uniref:alpha/beta fold hydrolase n=1 Tax=Sorangium sp. So ce1335 TaxID=3133335 RepID=UPI003F5DC2F4
MITTRPTTSPSRRRALLQMASIAAGAAAACASTAPADPRPDGDWTTIHGRDGTPLAVRRVGDGPPLVIAHGALTLADDWLAAQDALGAHFTCILYERRGRGRSGDGPVHTLDHEIDDLLVVREHAGPDAAVLGHSYGGILALEAALRAPLRAMALYEPPLDAVDGPRLAAYEAILREQGPDAALAYSVVEIVGTPPELLPALRADPRWAEQVAMTPTWHRELRSLAALPPGAARYSDVAARAALLLGGETPERPLGRATRALLGALPDARLHLLPGQGHVAHLTAPRQLADAVRRALLG